MSAVVLISLVVGSCLAAVLVFYFIKRKSQSSPQSALAFSCGAGDVTCAPGQTCAYLKNGADHTDCAGVRTECARLSPGCTFAGSDGQGGCFVCLQPHEVDCGGMTALPRVKEQFKPVWSVAIKDGVLAGQPGLPSYDLFRDITDGTDLTTIETSVRDTTGNPAGGLWCYAREDRDSQALAFRYARGGAGCTYFDCAKIATSMFTSDIHSDKGTCIVTANPDLPPNGFVFRDGCVGTRCPEPYHAKPDANADACQIAATCTGQTAQDLVTKCQLPLADTRYTTKGQILPYSPQFKITLSDDTLTQSTQPCTDHFDQFCDCPPWQDRDTHHFAEARNGKLYAFNGCRATDAAVPADTGFGSFDDAENALTNLNGWMSLAGGSCEATTCVSGVCTTDLTVCAPVPTGSPCVLTADCTQGDQCNPNTGLCASP